MTNQTICYIDLITYCCYNIVMSIEKVLKRKPSFFEITKAYFYEKNASKWILERAKSFDYITYDNVKSRLQRLKYKFLQNYATFAGSYSPEEHRVGIYGKDNVTQSTILHETLHGCSNNKDRFSEFSKNYPVVGFMGRYNTYMTDDIVNGFVTLDYGSGLNEAATEFFTYDILDNKNKKYKIESNYTALTNIFAIFSTVYRDGKTYIDEYTKQTLFRYYLNAEYNMLVNYLSNAYNTPKSKIQLLFLQFDKVLEYKGNFHLSFEMVVRSYGIIYEMEYNRFKAKNKNGTLEEFLNSPEIKEVINYKTDMLSFSASNIAKNIFISRFENYKSNVRGTRNLSDYILNFCFDKKTNLYDIKANSFAMDMYLSNADRFNKKYKNLIKNSDDYEKLSALLLFSSMEYFDKKLVREDAIKETIENIVKYGVPENENCKKDFMYYLLNIPDLKNGEYYKNFSANEIVNYLKSDKEKLFSNKSNIKQTSKLQEYLKDAKDYKELFGAEQEEVLEK